MREFIREQIEHKNSVKGQLKEVDLSAVMGKLKGLVTTREDKVNREFAEIVSKKFDGEFSEYLKNSLIKAGKSVNTLGLVVKYLKNSNDKTYEGLFEIIGLPMLDYFVNKTFGQASVGGKIKQMTPFMQKVSTGNSELDRYVFEALGDALNDKVVRKAFSDKLKRTLHSKMEDMVDDQDFIDLFRSTEDKNENLEISETKKKARRQIKELFPVRATWNKFQLADKMVENMPNLKRSIRREIKNSLDDMSLDELKDMMKNMNTSKAARATTEPILRHIIKNSQQLYFNKGAFGELIEVVKNVFLDDKVVYHVQKNIKKFLRDAILKTKEKQRRTKKKRK